MYIARGLLILSFGSMLRFISCYSDGGLLEDYCQEMNINHDGSAQATESPFKVEPESVTLTETATISGRLSLSLSLLVYCFISVNKMFFSDVSF